MKYYTHISIVILLYFFAGINPGFNTQDENKEKIDSTMHIPAPISPTSGTYFLGDTLLFQWMHQGENTEYEIMFSTVFDFSINETEIVSDTTYKKYMGHLQSGQLYWKVRAKKDKKTYSQWSYISVINIGEQVPVDIIRGGCRGNCGSCPNPCGRRRGYDDIIKEPIEIKTE